MIDLQALRAQAAEHERGLVAFCRRLVQTPSPSGAEGELAQLVAGEMERLGYDDVRIDEVGNVVGLLRGSEGGRSVMFNGHLDHVDAGDQRGWRYPPFEGRIADGAIWGRGTMDMKGPLAAQVYGVVLLRAAGVRLPGDVHVAGAVQEEVGGLGSVELSRTTRTDCAVIGEATGNELRRGQRGRIELIVRVSGESCHASTPEQGINPHYSVARLVDRLRGLDVVTDPVLGPESLSPTLLFTDQTSSNVVPAEIRLHIDWRTVPGRTADDVCALVQDLLDASLVDGAEGSVEVKGSRLRTYAGAERDLPAAFPSFLLDEDHRLLSSSRSALREAFGREPRVGRWSFATDGGHLMAAGIPCVGFGPGDEHDAHTNREHLDLGQLTDAMLGNAVLAATLTAPGLADAARRR